MTDFATPTDLLNNRGLIADPEAFSREEFASVEGGMSYADVERAVPVSANVVSDPPTPLDLDLAREIEVEWSGRVGDHVGRHGNGALDVRVRHAALHGGELLAREGLGIRDQPAVVQQVGRSREVGHAAILLRSR